LTSYRDHIARSKRKVAIAVVVVSDSRTGDSDESGPAARRLLEEGGHVVSEQILVGNDGHAIEKAVKGLLANPQVDAIITIGGTGMGKKDITVETLSGMMEKELNGFGELFRMMSYEQIGTGAIMSRSTAGVAGGKVVICLPGSKSAVELAIKRIIVPEIGHMVTEATR